MKSGIDGRVVLITGAGRGIGASYAEALGGAGARLALSDIDTPDEVAEVVRAAGGTAFGMACDITDPHAVAAFVRRADAEYGAIHALVNNAGLFTTLSLKPLEEIGSKEWDQVMAVNIRGSFECVKAVVPVMRRQSYGKIVNIASGTVFKGIPFMLHYVTSKGAIVAMTRALARELGDAGIRCNCLAPGLTMSEGVKASADWQGAAATGNIASRCLKREATPEDLAGTLLYLVGPGSDFMTGQTIVVDGGSVTH